MNLNKGCIEIEVSKVKGFDKWMMNLNKGCIEIVTTNSGKMPISGWTLTRVVLKFK